MSNFAVPCPITGVFVKAAVRRFTNSTPVLGADNNPAVGRTVLALVRDKWGRWAIAAETTTDSSGNYAISLNAGPNERFVIVCIGAAGEYTKVLGDMTAVI